MPKLTLSRSIALALTLTLSLTACGTEETAPTAPTPAPEPMLQELAAAAAPLVADGPPVVTGGTLVDQVFQSDESRGEHCVSYRAALPPALKGMELRVAPVVPIISLAGRPSCSGPVQAALTYSTDAWIWPRALPAEQVAMERGASMLTINLCFRGVQRAQLGDLRGSVSYARIQPLHR